MMPEEFKVLYNLEGKYWWFLGRTKIAFSMLNCHIKKNIKPESSTKLKILDAGCGTGKNIEYLQKFGTVHGIDFSEDAITFCHKRGLENIKKGSIEFLPYNDNTFDIVTCFGVLYHKGIKNDLKAVQELVRVCKPGGIVLITTPAGEFLMNPLFYSQHEIAQHTGRKHSKKRLTKLMQKSNLIVLETTYMNMFLMPFVILVRIYKNIFYVNIFNPKEIHSDLEMPSKFINKTLLRILLLENWLIKRITLPFGLTIIGIGRKK